MKTLTIDRKTWARGGRGGQSALLNADGNMCCLGFLGKACGAQDSKLDVAMPSDTGVTDARVTYWSNLANILWPTELFEHHDSGHFVSSDLERHISDINDDVTIDDAERESKLRPLFKKIGYRLEFK